MKVLAITLVLVTFMTACGSAPKEEIDTLDRYGSSLARDLARRHPERPPYSVGERATAQFIVREFEKLGYQPKMQSFKGEPSEEDASVPESANIIVRIPGNGFERDEAKATDLFGKKDPDKPVGRFRATIVIGAHYDTIPQEPEEEDGEDEEKSEEKGEESAAVTLGNFDGISDNASGIAVLLALARDLKEQSSPIGYDIILAAFGAGADARRGSHYFYKSLSKSERNSLDCVYILESLYAGDNLYASAGLSSAQPGKKMDLRLRLYEFNLAAVDAKIRRAYGVDILNNTSSLKIPLPGHEPEEGKEAEQILYREFTLHPGDCEPFDLAGIPCVYIESYNYRGDTVEEMRDNRSPEFASVNGNMRGSRFDSTRTLDEIMPDNTLTLRINAVARTLSFVVKRGLLDAKVADGGGNSTDNT
ncbi:MAG: M28 family peptidase [Clostridiaceae bacterium]|mgnify:CR=1 FL=1|nr:M28 family peptidase [Clostridiaceae bacterium]